MFALLRSWSCATVGGSSPPPCESTGGMVHNAACLTTALLPGVTVGTLFLLQGGLLRLLPGVVTTGFASALPD